jgi:hypothetical protein
VAEDVPRVGIDIAVDPVADPAVPVAPADPAGLDLDDDAIGIWIGGLDVAYVEWFAEVGEGSGSHSGYDLIINYNNSSLM